MPTLFQRSEYTDYQIDSVNNCCWQQYLTLLIFRYWIQFYTKQINICDLKTTVSNSEHLLITKTKNMTSKAYVYLFQYQQWYMAFLKWSSAALLTSNISIHWLFQSMASTILPVWLLNYVTISYYDSWASMVCLLKLASFLLRALEKLWLISSIFTFRLILNFLKPWKLFNCTKHWINKMLVIIVQ